MANKRLGRGQLRVLHLIAAAPIMGYFYGPLAGAAWIENILRFGVLPALALSGIIMWQLPRFRRFRAVQRRSQARNALTQLP